jgi:D-arginine dehydrogenase
LEVEPIDEDETRRRVPALAPGRFAGAAWLPESGFIDVPALIEAYVAQARRRGVVFRFGGGVSAIESVAGRADAVVVLGETFRGRVIVNAAGAWAGPIARMAGALAIELMPYRRSIVTYPSPPGLDPRGWPLVWSDAHRIYFRPGFDGLMVCPMDEEPSDPCEPAVDPRVVAQGLERLRFLAPGLVPTGPARSWAGLRTFAPDRRPVIGQDPVRPGFFWLAGQGGSGIETSRVLAQVASDLIIDGATSRLDPSPLTATRFR